MTDREITIALAERVMGWKHVPGAWLPFHDWNDAMELAEKWSQDNRCEYGVWFENGGFGMWGPAFPHSPRDASGPRAVTLAIARALGLEVG